VAALTLRLEHRQGSYNAVQRVLYLGVLAVASGLAVWKPVQLWWLSDLFGGFRVSRFVHFFAMAGIVAFLRGLDASNRRSCSPAADPGGQRRRRG
jgi:thiosulfate reductase cytochrome b subunit